MKLHKYFLDLIECQRDSLSSASFIFLVKVIGAFLSLLLNILLSRFLGAENVGIYFLSLSVVNIAIVLSMVGLGNAIIKYSALAYMKNDWEGLLGLHGNSVVIVTSVATMITSLIVVLAPWVASVIFHNPKLSTIIRWMSLGILPMSLVGIYTNLLKGAQKFVFAAMTENLTVSVIIITGLLVLKSQIDVLSVGMCYVVAAIVNLILGVVIWRFVTIDRVVCTKKYFNYKKLLKASFPLYVVAIMNMVMGVSDTVMLGFWKENYVVGIYGVALRITAISSILLIVVNTVLAPKFSIFFENGEHDRLSQLARNSTVIMMLISILCLVLFVSIPDFILSLFGKEFIAGKTILIILAVGQFVVLSTGPVAALLMMTGYEKFHRDTTTLSAILNIMLNCLLIPIYGGVGAAFATAFSLSLKNILAVLHVRKQLGIKLFI